VDDICVNLACIETENVHLIFNSFEANILLDLNVFNKYPTRSAISQQFPHKESIFFVKQLNLLLVGKHGCVQH